MGQCIHGSVEDVVDMTPQPAPRATSGIVLLQLMQDQFHALEDLQRKVHSGARVSHIKRKWRLIRKTFHELKHAWKEGWATEAQEAQGRQFQALVRAFYVSDKNMRQLIATRP